MEGDQLARLLAGWADGAGSLADRLALALRELVASGLLVPGTRLPPERTFAALLGVSRPTVGAALTRLRADGIVEARQGSGTWVTHRDVRSTRRSLVDHALASRGLNLAASVASDAGHLGAVRLDLDDLLGVHPAHGYAPAGLQRLRELIAARHRRQGLRTGAGQLRVTHGAHDALWVVLSALTVPGDVILTEEYTYPGLLDLCTAAGLRAVGVPVDRDGPQPAALHRLLRDLRPAACILAPACNNPTGRTSPPDRVEALAEVVDRHEVAVVEDNALADLVFAGRPETLAQQCRRAPVVSVESLSKSAWGGLRLGWFRMPTALRARCEAHHDRVDLGVSVPSQLLACQILEQFDELLVTRRGVVRERTAHLRAALSEAMPGWVVPEVHGGLGLWVDTTLADAAPLVAAAAARGVEVLPGAAARVGGHPSGWVRIGVDRAPAQLDEAVSRLRQMWDVVAPFVGGPGPVAPPNPGV